MKPPKILLLRAEVESDLADLERVVSEIAGLLMDIGSGEPSYRDKAAIGALLHSFYNGIENILKRIAVEIDESVPVGDGWHRALLKRMEKDVVGVRPAVLDHDTVSALGPYLGFRHFFRHSYTFELDWMKVKPLVEEAESVLQRFRRDIESFFAAVSES